MMSVLISVQAALRGLIRYLLEEMLLRHTLAQEFAGHWILIPLTGVEFTQRSTVKGGNLPAARISFQRRPLDCLTT